jgi:hypothetical protein
MVDPVLEASPNVFCARHCLTCGTGTPCDQPLVDAIKAGKVEALGRLYDRHSPIVYGLCLQLAINTTEAENFLIDAFERLWRLRAQLHSPPEGLEKCLLAFAMRAAASRPEVVRGGSVLAALKLPRKPSDKMVTNPAHILSL